MAIDPVLSAIIRFGLAGLFGFAALHKARDLEAFGASVRDYRIVPDRVAGAASMILIASEVAIAIAIVIPATGSVAGVAAGCVLLTYTAAIGLNLVRGRQHIDCGCLGPGRRQPISSGLLLRNAVLIAAALLASIPPSTRAVGWIDAVSLCCGLAAVVLLFGAASQLVAQASTSQSLRRSP